MASIIAHTLIVFLAVDDHIAIHAPGWKCVIDGLGLFGLCLIAHSHVGNDIASVGIGPAVMHQTERACSNTLVHRAQVLDGTPDACYQMS